MNKSRLPVSEFRMYHWIHDGNYETSSMFHVSYEGLKLFSIFCYSLGHSKFCGLTDGAVDHPTLAGYGMKLMRCCSAKRPSENVILST